MEEIFIMSRFGKQIFWFVIALTVSVQVVRSQNADDLGIGVKKAVSDYDAAWNKKDVAAVGKILADDYVYFTSMGGTSDRKSTLEFLASPSYKLTFVERSEIVLHRHDGKIAVVSSRWKGKGTWEKGEINDDQRCGQVFIKDGRQWKMISEHCVQLKAD